MVSWTGGAAAGRSTISHEVEAVFGPRCQRRYHVPITVFGKTIPFDRRGANQLLRAAMKAYEVDYRVYDIQSFNCRKTTSGKSWSIHSWAIAVDINPATNPYTTRGRVITDMPREFIECFTSEGFGWGGNWRSVKDAMHYSLAPNEGGRPRPRSFETALQQAAVELWVARHRGVNVPPSDPPKPKARGKKAPPYPGYEMTQERWRRTRTPDENVERLQERLAERGWRIKTDGKFDAATETVVRAFQREKLLEIDGVVGKNSWRLIWEAPLT